MTCEKCFGGLDYDAQEIDDELLCGNCAEQIEKGMWKELQWGLEESLGSIAARRVTVLA